MSELAKTLETTINMVPSVTTPPLTVTSVINVWRNYHLSFYFLNWIDFALMWM